MLRLALSLFTFAFFCCVLCSCDDEETPDTAAPQITIESPKENQRVHRMMTIEASAEDRSADLSMKAYLDGNLLKESSGVEISAEVNTETLSEGTHTVKVTATDKAGNTSEKSVNIEVRNILFKVQVASNYIPPFTEIYFALSRNDGTFIAVEKVENGGVISVPTPADFNPDSTFVFAEYFYLHQPPSEWGLEYLIKSRNYYAGMNAGEFNVAQIADAAAVKGTHHLEITEVPASYYSAHVTGSSLWIVSGNFGNSGTITSDLSMTNTTSDLYFRFQEQADAIPAYKYISSVAVGGSTHFSAETLKQLDEVSVSTKDGSGNYYYDISDSNQRLNFNSDNRDFTDGKLKLYYPAGIYPEYTFSINYQLGADTYMNRMRGATPPSSFQYLDAEVNNVNYASRQLKVTTSGNFDIISIQGGTNFYDGTLFSLDAYTVTFPHGTKQQITIPAIPDELSELEFSSPGDFAFTRAGFYDYLDTSGASDYQGRIVFSSDNVPRYLRDYVGKLFDVTPTNTGGRLSTQEKIELPTRLKTILRDRFPQGM